MAVAAAAGLSSRNASARPTSGTISLVAYSTPRDAYAKLIPAFTDSSAGKGTSFQQSYGASGEQARAVIAGLKADVVAFSLEPDMTSLVKARLVAPTWKKNKFGGMVTRSVVVFVVRKGNPKHIRSWNDLIKSDVDVVVPNVQTSGGAKWDVMAAYGAQRKLGKSHAQSVKYLEKLYDHVVSQDKSAREALQTFLAGRGDVLLSYENEAIFAQKHDQPVDYVIPRATISIENPIAVVKTSSNKATANAFVRYLRTRSAQLIFGDNGYRPVLRSAAKKFGFPVPKMQFTIKYLGGWAKVDKRFFDSRNGIVTKIQRKQGG
ncbi:MAG TPA: sulfate ABC transporter substrate-binding protein [Gaiellaceae bacterium]